MGAGGDLNLPPQVDSQVHLANQLHMYMLVYIHVHCTFTLCTCIIYHSQECVYKLSVLIITKSIH